MTVRITRSQRSAGTIGLYRIDGCFDIIFAYYPNEIAIVIIIIPRCFFFRRTRLGRAAPHHRDIILVWNIIIMITYYRRTRRGVFRTRFSIFDNSGGEEARRCAPSSARCPRVSFVSGTGYTIFFSSIPPPIFFVFFLFWFFFFFYLTGHVEPRGCPRCHRCTCNLWTCNIPARARTTCVPITTIIVIVVVCSRPR